MPRQRVADHTRAQFNRAGLPVLPVALVQRAAFQTMTYTGKLPYQQTGGEAAAENVASLADAVVAIVGLDVPHGTTSPAAKIVPCPAPLRRSQLTAIQGGA